MERLQDLLPHLLRWLPAVLTVPLGCGALMLVDRALRRRETSDGGRIGRQLVMLGLTTVWVIAIVVSLDIETSQKNQLLSLLGLLR